MPIENLNKKLRILNYAKRKKKTGSRRVTKALVVLVILTVAIYLPVRGAYSAVKEVVAAGREISQGIKQENLDQIREGIIHAKVGVEKLNSSLNWLVWLKVIPFVGGYYGDGQHFAKAAGYELEAAQIATNILDPYKEELGFIGQPTPGQDKIAQGVKVLDKILPNLDKIEPKMKQAREEVEGIDTGKYPEKFGTKPLRSLIEDAKNFIIGVDIALSKNRDAVGIAPLALGSASPKTYLLLFQNDKEIRATGGFITAYAFLNLDKGHLSTTASDDIYRLDERLLSVCKSKICPLTPPAPSDFN